MSATQDLIETLSGRLQPVTPARPPLLRAMAFVLVCLLLVAAAAGLTHAWPLMLMRLADPRFAVELAATAMTGITGIAAAFMLAAYRPAARMGPAAASLPRAMAVEQRLWLLSQLARDGNQWAGAGESAHCFMFIIGFAFRSRLLCGWPCSTQRPGGATR